MAVRALKDLQLQLSPKAEKEKQEPKCDMMLEGSAVNLQQRVKPAEEKKFLSILGKLQPKRSDHDTTLKQFVSTI